MSARRVRFDIELSRTRRRAKKNVPSTGTDDNQIGFQNLTRLQLDSLGDLRPRTRELLPEHDSVDFHSSSDVTSLLEDHLHPYRNSTFSLSPSSDGVEL